MKRLLLIFVMIVTFSTTASAEQFSGRMIFNSKDAGVLGLKTTDGILMALSHSAAMKLDGIKSLDNLNVCDEISVDVTASGPLQVIGAIHYKNAGKAEECHFPTAASVPAANLYKALQDKSAVVYDVRSIGEHNKAHFEGSINIPLTEIAGRLNELPADKPIILYCASAKRSAYAAAMLMQKGIKTSIVKGRFVVKDGKPLLEE